MSRVRSHAALLAPVLVAAPHRPTCGVRDGEKTKSDSSPRRVGREAQRKKPHPPVAKRVEMPILRPHHTTRRGVRANLMLALCVLLAISATCTPSAATNHRRGDTRQRRHPRDLEGQAVPRSPPTCKVSIIGAGFGGLYAAFRLMNDTRSGYTPSEICVFEKSDRVGGRALTLSDSQGDNVFPMKNRVSLGAHRWNPVDMPIVDAVITDVLTLNSECYSHTGNCVDSEPSYYDLRNGAYTGDLSDSEVPGFPYFLDPSEQWATYNTMPDPLASMVALYPVIDGYLSALGSRDPAVDIPRSRPPPTRCEATPSAGRSQIPCRSCCPATFPRSCGIFTSRKSGKGCTSSRSPTTTRCAIRSTSTSRACMGPRSA